MVVKKTYTSDIKNPYLSKGNFLWKHNSDEKLGDDWIFKDEREREYLKKRKEARKKAETEGNLP